ncbi:protein of unknown function [Taphrina deformans PYCC 5710]|uniref:HIG1 domain-containing protein n=1 Tax=Taphrina deformans (strain PYCC 5710 / ATCC 11124 / CBS 356.35 / IMI 108563 / JCM 9778 / NBRC 8474) TaxID=1097556 RepID=R4XK62_TAPDE|nr:protein of unknown function [Taphrina deformans PYCC 5710]|eukprot:CCG84839.1 protein of unknown function [Taphrina deformans PYCC 5710]
MKILSEKEEAQHYSKVLEGGTKYGLSGLAASSCGLFLARKYSPGIRALTIPFQAFLVTGVSVFSLIIGADRYSRNYEQSLWSKYEDTVVSSSHKALLSPTQRAMRTFNEYRWHIIGGTWLSGMIGSMVVVNRNKYLSTSQKLVQARMYAQGITLAIVLLSAGIAAQDSTDNDGEDIIMQDPVDPSKQLKVHHAHKETYAGENQWQDMIAAQERIRGAQANGSSKTKQDK